MVVVGAGVAGSVFAYLASRHAGLDVKVYDMAGRYHKPCGESIPAWVVDSVLPEYGIPQPVKLNSITSFKILDHEGRLLNSCDSEKPVWYIIDKSGWIDSLRSSIHVEVKPIRSPSSLCRSYDVIVDARGPFGSRGGKVVVWRAYATNSVGLSREAILVMDWRQGAGLAWLFPYGRSKLNVGGGFVGVKDPKRIVTGILSRLYGISYSDIDSEAYSLVTVKPDIVLWEQPCSIRVGEAAGLIMALGGEGIRPAILSSIAAVKALLSSGGVDHDRLRRTYSSLVRSLVSQVKFQKRLLTLAEMLGVKSAYKLLSNMPKSLVCRWFEGRLTSTWQVVKGLILKHA